MEKIPLIYILVYIRVSTDKQDMSAERQEATIRRHIEHKYKEDNLSIRFFTDIDVSARLKNLSDRKAGAELCFAVEMLVQENPEASIRVMAVKLDRVFRNSVDGILTEKKWTSIGVPMLFIDNGGNQIDTATAVGRFLFRMLLSWAEAEADITSERTFAALKSKREKGQATSKPSWGTMQDKKNNRLKFASDTHKDIIDKVKELRILGNSYQIISDMIKAQFNVAVPRDTVNRITKNESYQYIKHDEHEQTTA